MEPILIIKAAFAAASVCKYLDFIEDKVSADIKKLMHQSFESAKLNLNAAKRSTSAEECNKYLTRAVQKFHDAIAVEENENKVSCYLGLAICQYLLGDTLNAEFNIENIAMVELSKREMKKYKAMDLGKTVLRGVLMPPILLLPVPPPITSSYDARIRIFNEYKIKARQTKFE